jgi:catechol 2,3-dioxygenase-like lactoylglutathione lyase family enzyme
MAMGEIRHMAMCTRNNRRLARFYYFVFGMQEVWNKYQNSPYAFYIGDGSFQLNCLQIRPGTSYAKIVDGREILPDVGMNHIGFQVKSMADVEKRLAGWNPPIRLEKSPQDGRYEERRFTDPDGNLFELAEGAWDAGSAVEFGKVSYVGLRSGDPERLAEFYRSVLSLNELRKVDVPETHAKAIYLSDGRLNLGIYRTAPDAQPGLDRLGFHVKSIDEVRNRIRNSDMFLYPGEPPIDIEKAAAWNPYKTWELKDPDGNTVEVSDRGWEV